MKRLLCASLVAAGLAAGTLVFGASAGTGGSHYARGRARASWLPGHAFGRSGGRHRLISGPLGAPGVT